MIETHAHIYDDQFDEDRDTMLKRAFDAGVKQIWMPNCDHETIDGMLALEQQYPGVCLPMMGVHPCYIKENFEVELNIVENWLAQRTFPMIGDIGFDFYWDLNFVHKKAEAFIAH